MHGMKDCYQIKAQQQVCKKREKHPSVDLLDPNSSVLQKQKYTIKTPEPDNIPVEGAN